MFKYYLACIYIFAESEKLIRIFRSALYSYTEVPFWTIIIKASYFLKTLCEMLAVLHLPQNIILILHCVPNYIHQSIVSKYTSLLVLSEFHDVVLCISATIQ